MYVSAVDSGNLSGHLLAVAAACRELARAPYDDALPQALAALQLRLAGSAGVDVRRWLHEDIAATEASAALDQDRPADAGTRLLALAALCEAQAWAPDFAFLYHRKRHLLHLGYRVAEQQLDAGFYDLLASESRLTSLLAIAKGDVPVRHWAALGRPFYGVGGRAGLRSWSGSMFEYLMPSLVLAEPPGSVLQGACAAALAEQQAFGAAQRLPWGVSESAYAAADHTLAYQYAPQGVPRLALRRTPIDALVVAPYATALAAPLSPHGAWRNFEALAALGARGRYGFIEALDFSPARQLAGDRVTPVATYMSHHQGMTIVALANVLLDGVAQRWGMADPHIEAVTSLLHEAAPREVPRLLMPVTGQQLPAEPGAAPALWHAVPPGDAAVPPTQLLGNGRYGVTLRPNGAGASRCGADGVTRERDDALRDAHGSFLFVRWDRHPALTSLTLHPAPDLEAHYGCSFHADRVVFDTAWPALQVQTTVWVSPEDDIEFREVCLSNLDGREIDIELISAIEPTLCPPRADEAHPAFTKLFLGTQWWPAQQALVFTRTPRLAGEAALQAAHFIAGSEGQVIDVALQTDRAAWLGRHRDASQPLAQLQPAPDGGETALATGLDPVGVLAVRLRLPRHGQARVTFATAASADAATLRAVVDKYRQPSHVQRASLMSATLAGIRLRALRLGAADQAALQVLSTALLQTLTRPLAPAAAACDRRTLWALGLSGDRPIVLVSAGNLQGLGLLRTLAQGLRQWAWAGVACDLVLVNTEAASYQMTLQQEMAMLRDRHAGEGGTTTALLALQRDAIAPETWRTLQQRACVRLVADGRPLAHHVQVWSELHDAALELRHATSTTALALRPVHDTPLLPAGGAFDSASGRYVFDCDATQAPPRPWINVLANPAFGALLSESGGGHTWALNSRMQQLTAWGNDPVADLPAEWWLLQDLRSREAWSVAPSAWADGSARYTVEHGQGGTRITHRRGDLAVEAAWCVDAGSAVKQLRLRVVNHGSRTQRLRVFGLVEWLLGATRSERATVQVQAHTQRLPGGRLLALLATQHEAAGGFGGGTAFLAVAGSDHEGGDGSGEDWTCDRRECFDARGRLVLPDHLGRHGGTGLDPCAALSLPLTLAAGAAGERVFLIGWAPTPEAARLLAASAAVVPAAARWSAVHADWDARLGTTTVTTPDPLFDVLVNRWLLYQALSCRLWAKAGFYQAGGATGFRDQLQDTLALAWSAPELLRAQILLCASRQFAEGDVQHWWHAPGGAGVRTHFSDDLLWLAHACVHHQRCTGRRHAARRAGPVPGRCRHPRRRRGRVRHAAGRQRERQRLRTRGTRHRPQPGDGRAQPAADGQRRLERRHEPRRPRRAGRIGVAGLVPVPAGGRLRAAGTRPRRGCARAALAGRGLALARRAAGRGLGRRVVQARLLRRRHGAGRQRQRRGAHRPHRAGLGRAGRRRAAAAAGACDGLRRSAAGRHRPRPAAPAGPAAGARAAERRLHPGLPAGRARERRPVHPWRGVGADGAGRTGAAHARRPRRAGPRLPRLHLAQPGAPRSAPGVGPGLRAGALCRGRRRVFAAALHRPRRLELVHRRRGLDAPRRDRRRVRPALDRARPGAASVPAVALAAGDAGAPARRPHDALHAAARHFTQVLPNPPILIASSSMIQKFRMISLPLNRPNHVKSRRNRLTMNVIDPTYCMYLLRRFVEPSRILLNMQPI